MMTKHRVFFQHSFHTVSFAFVTHFAAHEKLLNRTRFFLAVYAQYIFIQFIKSLVFVFNIML